MGYLITNVRILDATGRQPFPGTVRIEGNRIAEVVDGTATPPAAGAMVIDGAGATLMPGLIRAEDQVKAAAQGKLEPKGK
jgi:imidazolonepropionase-like amidohydrolase